MQTLSSSTVLNLHCYINWTDPQLLLAIQFTTCEGAM